MAVGMFRGGGLEASGNLEMSSLYGDGMGEYEFSEKVVVEETGDVVPPHPKKEPSFDVPGDLGRGFCMVVLESVESFE
jgi:hypothetical protein